MGKRVSDNQDLGYIGEGEFALWANKIGWYPTKVLPDHGLDFLCQIKEDRIGGKSAEMRGKLLTVSVRSTDENGDSIVITRSDAQLVLETNISRIGRSFLRYMTNSVHAPWASVPAMGAGPSARSPCEPSCCVMIKPDLMRGSCHFAPVIWPRITQSYESGSGI